MNCVVATSLLALEGRFADAERRADEALSLGLAANPGAPVAYTMQLATLRVTQGHREGLEAVAEMLRQLVAQFPGMPIFATRWP
jgi:hypothetical protein